MLHFSILVAVFFSPTPLLPFSPAPLLPCSPFPLLPYSPTSLSPTGRKPLYSVRDDINAYCQFFRYVPSIKPLKRAFNVGGTCPTSACVCLTSDLNHFYRGRAHPRRRCRLHEARPLIVRSISFMLDSSARRKFSIETALS